MDRLRTAHRGWVAIKRSVVWQLFARQKPWLIGLVVFGGLSGTAAVLSALTIRDLLDEAIIEKTHPLGDYVENLRNLAILGAVTGFVALQFGARIGYHLEYELRLWLYQRLQATNPRLLDALASGQVITRSLTDLQLLEAIILVVPAAALAVFILVLLFVYLVVNNPIMGMLALAAIPVNAVVVARIRERLWGLSWLVLNRRAEVTTAIDEPVRGMRVVKAFGREEHERRRVAGAARKAYAVSVGRVRLVARYDVVLRAMPIVVNAALLFVGGRQVASGKLSVGELIIFFAVSAIFTGFASSFDEIVSGWTFAGTGAGRIFELVTMTPDADPTSLFATPPRGSQPLAPSPTGLELRGVSLGIGTATLVEGIDVVVEPGGLTVLTGPPGSGKSLVAAVAAGHLPATAGRVLLDGVPLGELAPEALRAGIRVLVEDPFLFGRTVRENLTMGGQADDDALRAALHDAAVETVVDELPGGLDAVLGDRGLTLSGGQRQRLALARALVAPPRALVLDDALSAVNPALEIEILRRIRARHRDLAILAITRREGLRSEADRVIELPPAPAEFARRRDEVMAWVTELRDQLDEAPPDPRMQAAVAAVAPDRDEPPVSDDEATASDEAPGVRNVLRPFRRQVVIAAGLLILMTAATLVPEALAKFAIDDFGKRQHGTADKVVLAVALTGFVIGGLSYAFKLAAAKVGEGAMYVLRRRTFDRLTRLGIDYYDRELPGQVAARVVHDLDRIGQFVDQGVYRIASATALLIGTVAVLFVWSPPVARVVAVFVAVAIVVTAVQVPFAARAYLRQRLALGDVVARFQEDLAGRYVIDTFGVKTQALAGFGTESVKLRSARKYAATVANLYISAIQAILQLATMALLATAGRLALDETLSLGSMVALQLYLVNALAPIPQLSGVLQSYLAARTSFGTLRQPFVSPILPVERAGARPCPPLRGDLALDRVHFTYPGTARAVLHDVSLEIPSGALVALVGPTGAGKSSIAKLLARIYDPDDGAVTADAVDLRDIDLDTYRRRLGIVPQDAFCFRGRVRDNVAYGLPEATDEQLHAAAALVGADAAIAQIPDGWDGRVEEEGRNLTAAQRQHLAIARAVVREPDVLVLDEATSSLDPDAEAQLLTAVRDMGRTTILVTHRLPVARSADLVAVVDGGRIVEVGTHDGLVARDGAYRALWAFGPDVELTQR